MLIDSLHSPTDETRRIKLLDVLRGFSLLGILLLNIIGFGLLSPSYSNPAYDLTTSGTASVFAWGAVDMFAEGAMRGLFSILFGAGVVLFTVGMAAKSAWTYYKRTFWLLALGLFDAYILLWNGDILVTYAVAGAILYLLRSKSAKTLLIAAGILIILMSALHATLQLGFSIGYEASERIEAASTSPQRDTISAQDKELAAGWDDFIKDFELSPAKARTELNERTGSYGSAFSWNAEKNLETYTFVLPVFLLWDALAMMMIGMALFKMGVLQATRSPDFYCKLMVIGLSVGLLINGYEVSRAYASNFSIFSTFGQMQPSYHIGRTAVAVGYIGLLGWICQKNFLVGLTARLSAVGRMALTNYLMHSLICALIFTGMGLGLLGRFERAELYGIVVAIWTLQLWLSPLWLRHFHFGPVEWLWRTLTYGSSPALRR